MIKVPYDNWPEKAISWVRTRNLFNLDEPQEYTCLGTTDYEYTPYAYDGDDPKMPTRIRVYAKHRERVAFLWAKSNPFKNQQGPRWICFFRDNIIIEWDIPSHGTGIHLTSWNEYNEYTINGKSTSFNEEEFKTWYLITHLEEFQFSDNRKLIRHWLYEQPMIGDAEIK